MASRAPRIILAAVHVAALLTAAALPAAGQDTEIDDWRIEKFDWSGPLGEAREIVIDNAWGDVRCRSTDGDEVVLVANLQRHKDDPRRADIRVKEEGERLVMAVVYPDEVGSSAVITAEMEKRRVDVSVLVPNGVRLEARTDKGLIEAKGLSGIARASSGSGKIVVKTSSALEARTERGTIDVTFAGTAWEEPVRLETLTGDVTVWLPGDASVVVEAETTGELSTDYSIEIERRGPNDKKHASARVGEGAGRLAITTEKGRVRLFRSRW